MEKYSTNLDLEILSLKEPHSLREKNEEFRDHFLGKSEEEVRPKKKKSAFKFYFINILLGFIIFGVVSAIVLVGFFTLEHIEYEGVVNANTIELENALFSDRFSDNTIYAWASNLVGEKKGLSFVKEVNVYMKNSNSVVVSVKEDELSGVIALDENKLLYFDSDGKVSEVSKKLVENVPFVEGISVSDYQENEAVKTDSKKFGEVISVLKFLKDKDITPARIIVDGDGTLGFYIGEIFVDLGLNDNIREIINRLPYILPNLEGAKGVLHFEDWGSTSSDVVFESLT